MIKEWIIMDNITIEKVDAVFERIPSATYADAKEALIKCSGDVVEAVVYLENQKKNKGKKAKETLEDVFGKDGEDIKNQLKDLLKKSSVVRVIVEKDNKVMMNIPLTVGVVGAALVPVITLVGLSAAVITKYRIKVQNEESGEVVDLGELNEEKLHVLKNMIVNTAKDVKDVVVDKNKDSKDDDKDITDDLMKEFESKNEKDEENK
jgi:ABC-type antimicrobial peptide transport system permease subunit